MLLNFSERTSVGDVPEYAGLVYYSALSSPFRTLYSHTTSSSQANRPFVQDEVHYQAVAVPIGQPRSLGTEQPEGLARAVDGHDSLLSGRLCRMAQG